MERISLDHDLGVGYSTGYKVACFIEQAAHEGSIPPIKRMYVHSANPVGKQRMGQALNNAYKVWKKHMDEEEKQRQIEDMWDEHDYYTSGQALRDYNRKRYRGVPRSEVPVEDRWWKEE